MVNQAVFHEPLNPGERFLLKIENVASFGPTAWERQGSYAVGEVQFQVVKVEEDRLQLSLHQLGLSGPGVQVGKELESGRFSYSSFDGSGSIKQQNDEWKIALDFKGEFVYELITREMGLQPVEGREGRYRTPPEVFSGNLHGTLVFDDGVPSASDWVVTDGSLNLLFQEGEVHAIDQVSVTLDEGQVVYRMFSEANPGEPFNGPCEHGSPQNLRTLNLLPVAFREAAGVAHTGQSWLDQFQMAVRIWDQACVQLNPLPLVSIDDADLVTELQIAALSNAFDEYRAQNVDTFSVPEKTVVIFHVNHPEPLTAAGGEGASADETTALAKIVIQDNVGNDLLLGHELGHVFFGLHPPDPNPGGSPFPWYGELNTVLEVANPNPGNNSFHNCSNARNPVLLDTVPYTSCCLTPDLL